MAPSDLDRCAVVALGSNLPGPYGTSDALLEAALARFPEVGLKVLRRSSLWRSAAWPDPDGPEYRNAVALVEAGAGARAVMAALQSLEERMGRERSARNAPRTLDLDLIAYGRELSAAPDLTLPHPRAHERLFVMGPLAEIAPDWIHPGLEQTAAQLAAAAAVGRDARPAGAGSAA